jgi:hypothetical protein
MPERYALVDKEGNVETLVGGDATDAVVVGQQQGFQVWVDETAQYEPELEDLIEGACDLAENPDRVSAELAWERTGYLQMHMDQVMQYSVKEAYEKLLPFFPKMLRARGHRDKGEIPRSWATRESMVENLLSGNYKTAKSFPFGQVSVRGLSLVPASMWSQSAGRDASTEYRNRPGALPLVSRRNTFNLCVGASAECIKSCLVFSGHNTVDPYNMMLKKAKTSAMMLEPEAFGRILLAACEFHQGGDRKRATPMVRLNIYSDVPWELVFPELFTALPNLQFYDYTKVPDRQPPANYDLTFSFSGRNLPRVQRELARGRKAAFVFMDTEKWADKKAPQFSPRRAGLPDQFLGYEVVDGDISDVRPYDQDLAEGAGPYIVALKWKPPRGVEPGSVDPSKMLFAVPVQEVDGRLVASITPRSEPDTDPNADTAAKGSVEADPAELQAEGLVANPRPRGRGRSPVRDDLKRKLMR